MSRDPSRFFHRIVVLSLLVVTFLRHEVFQLRWIYCCLEALQSVSSRTTARMRFSLPWKGRRERHRFPQACRFSRSSRATPIGLLSTPFGPGYDTEGCRSARTSSCRCSAVHRIRRPTACWTLSSLSYTCGVHQPDIPDEWWHRFEQPAHVHTVSAGSHSTARTTVQRTAMRSGGPARSEVGSVDSSCTVLLDCSLISPHFIAYCG